MVTDKINIKTPPPHSMDLFDINPSEETSLGKIPYWPDEVRGFPNVLARSALFRVADKRAERVYLKDVEVFNIGKSKVIYRGLELRQDDADVFLQLVHLAKNQDIGSPIFFTKYAMTKMLQWSQCTSSNERLKEAILRLTSCLLVVESDEGGFSGRLIDQFVWMNDKTNTEHQTWKIVLDPKILSMFNWASYSRVEWEMRMQLTPLEKWLHAYYSSHKKPLPIKVETLYMGCGSTAKNMHSFKQKLGKSMEHLNEVGFISSFKFEDDLLVVSR